MPINIDIKHQINIVCIKKKIKLIAKTNLKYQKKLGSTVKPFFYNNYWAIGWRPHRSHSIWESPFGQ